MLILQNFSIYLCLLYLFVILTAVNSVYLKHGLRNAVYEFYVVFFWKTNIFLCRAGDRF
jgi:cell division protein FtsL